MGRDHLQKPHITSENLSCSHQFFYNISKVTCSMRVIFFKLSFRVKWKYYKVQYQTFNVFSVL